mmetsp:Transcript_21587/g.45395  ORF Transcript_21587/g.45395 Transcript_21587/m.45395 type:complete len:265 (-) Transcript_21587:20-814(-)
MIKHMFCSLKTSVVQSKSLGKAVNPVFQSLCISSYRSVEAAGFKPPPSLTFNGRHSRCTTAPMSGPMNCRYFAVSSPNAKNAAKPVSRIVTAQAYIASAGRTVDPPPAVSAPPRPFFARMLDKLKTWSALRKMTAANPSIGFSRDLFPFEAERIFAATASAIENGDKSELRNLVTEKYYSALKKQLPEKKRGADKVTVATAGASIVQARRVALTSPHEAVFGQVVMDVRLEGTQETQRVVFERGLHLGPEGRWRVCECIGSPGP